MVTAVAIGMESSMMIQRTDQDRLVIDRIRRCLITETVGNHMYLFGAAEDTNAVLRHFAEAGAAEGTVVLAEGLSLAASVLVRADSPAPDASLFATLGCLAITDAARAQGVELAARWPHEAVRDGERVAMVTVEGGPAMNDPRWIVIGISANFEGRGEPLPFRAIDRNVFAATFLNHLEKWLLVCRAHGPKAIVQARRAREAMAAAPSPPALCA
jgi:hypothetical protein